MSSLVEYDGHRILVTYRSNATRLKLSWKPGREYFTLSVPPGCTAADIHKFLKHNTAWLRQQSDKQQQRWEPSLAAGERALLNGQWVILGRGSIPCGQAFIRLRAQCLQRTVQRLLPLWEQRMGVRISRVTIRDMSTRWGSCTPAKAHISLSLKLGAMPDDLIEQVLVHELCHMHHPDHSAAFYAEMSQYLPDWQVRKEQLEHMGPLHLPPEEETP